MIYPEQKHPYVSQILYILRHFVKEKLSKCKKSRKHTNKA